MDDISREPLPDSVEPTAVGDTSSTKGPAEVVRMAELVVDETQTDRLTGDVVETARLHSEPMRTESLTTESINIEPVGGRFASPVEDAAIVPESLSVEVAEPELVTAVQPLAETGPELEVLASGPVSGDLPDEPEDADLSEPQAGGDEQAGSQLEPLAGDAGSGDTDASLVEVPSCPEADTEVEVEAVPELYGPPLPEGLLDTHVRKLSKIAAAELADEAVPLTEAAEVSKVAMAVMLSTRESLSPMRLAEICNTSQKTVKEAMLVLEAQLRDQGLPLEVQQSGDGYKLLTVSAVHPYLRRIKGVKKVERLTPAALETLAVIAYRQPVIRAEVESIRGVKVGPMLRSLLDHKMIKVIGRADVPGRPLQYGTSQHFLERFGLASLKDLPSIQEFRSLG